MTYDFAGIVPDRRGEEEQYFEFCQQSRLCIQRCRDCRNHLFYPGAVCRVCTSRNIEWVDAVGRGTVHTFSWVHRPVAGFAGQEPYNVSIIDLVEGVRMMSRVMCSYNELRCDLPVRVAFAKIDDAFQVPIFVPESL